MISLRPAEESDRHLLLEWRNDPETRSASLSHEAVSDEEHDRWFSGALIDPNIIVYIGELDEEPVGTVRFDWDPDHGVADVSINLDPLHRGKGLSRPLLQQAVEAMRTQTAPGGTLRARIRSENVVSLRLFGQVGFVRTDVEDGVEVYELRPVTPADPS